MQIYPFRFAYLRLDEALEGLLREALALEDVVDVRQAEGELQVLVGSRLQAVTALDRLSVQQELSLDALASGQRLAGVAVEAKESRLLGNSFIIIYQNCLI